MSTPISRRSALRQLVGSAATLSAGAAWSARLGAAEATASEPRKGNINHSVCRWCYKEFSLDNLCVVAKEIGIKSIDLLGVSEFATVKKHGLICAMVTGVPGGIPNGLNRIENHDQIVDYFERTAPLVAEAGFPNIICFSGNRRGQVSEEGIKNCVLGMKRIARIVEKHGVTACMELLNSKVDHHDYQCDHTAWGVEVLKQVGSSRCKLLYDIYHMQIMEGDIIRTIRDYHEYLGHFHTGGVPGRHEIDDTQELNYAAVMRAIVGIGYKGWVAQEFLPSRGHNPVISLKQAIDICDV
ncbi:MAG: TIM barrel protein [Verrucomicrobia bacterium]|nr:TIM barrel protein [Verrucomicrobiota bacterium]